MLNRLFPKQIGNSYRGHWLGIPLLAVVVFIKGWQAVLTVYDTHNILMNGDGIPLDSYGAAASETVVAASALLAFNVLVIAVLGGVALIRYRTMIPFMFLVQLIVQLGSRVLLAVNPIARTAVTSLEFAGHPIGFYVNFAILAATVIGFILSLVSRPESPARGNNAAIAP